MAELLLPNKELKVPRFDLLGFVDEHDTLPTIHRKIGVAGMHATAAGPFMRNTHDVLNGITHPGGQYSPGVHAFRNHLESQGAITIRSKEDLRGIGQDGHIRILHGFQGSYPGAKDDVTELAAAGLRTIGLGYQRADDPYGPGFSDNERGLDGEARDYLSAVAAAGMIPDLSHSGHAAARQALEYIRDRRTEGEYIPVFASHTGVWGVTHDHGRNFPPDILEGIKELDGVVGMYALTFALHPYDNSVWPMLDNIHAAVDLLGIDRVAIGSDWIHKDLTPEQQLALYKKLNGKVNGNAFGARHPGEPEELNSFNKIEIIAELLRQDGCSEEEIDAICGGNAIRFLQESLN